MLNLRPDGQIGERDCAVRWGRAGSWSGVYRHVKVVAPSEPIKTRLLLALLTKQLNVLDYMLILWTLVNRRSPVAAVFGRILRLLFGWFSGRVVGVSPGGRRGRTSVGDHLSGEVKADRLC